MKHITVFENGRYTADAICQILHDNSGYAIQRVSESCADTSNIYKNTDVLVYCNQDCSNNYVHELKRIHYQYPKIRFVLITSFIYKQLLQRVFKSGAYAVISYKSTAADLYKAVDSAFRMQQFMGHHIGQMIVSNTFNSPISLLSNREVEITCMMANGMNIQRVSSLLNISPKTVSTYRSRIFNKLSISGNVELVRFVNKEAAYLLAG